MAVGYAPLRQRLAHLGQPLESLSRARAGQGLPPGHAGEIPQPSSGVHRARLPRHRPAGSLRQRRRLVGIQPSSSRPHRPQTQA